MEGISTEIRLVAEGEMDDLRELFLEYRLAAGGDVCFAGFETEVARLPQGCSAIVVAAAGGKLEGCVALRALGGGVCEMKRLYVRTSCRGTGLARRLVNALIDLAREAGLGHIRLDTLPTMKTAIQLYRSMGFIDIERYNDNPEPGTLFFEMRL